MIELKQLNHNVNKTQMIMFFIKIITSHNEVILRNEVEQRVTKYIFFYVLVDQHINWINITLTTQKKTKSCIRIFRISKQSRCQIQRTYLRQSYSSILDLMYKWMVFNISLEPKTFN